MTPTVQCFDCGRMIPPEEDCFYVRWERLAEDQIIGAGEAEYCPDCVPPGIPSSTEQYHKRPQQMED